LIINDIFQGRFILKSTDSSGQITAEVYRAFKKAIEIGKWPDGNKLSVEQRELCMQAVITWEHHNLEENERTGYLPSKPGECAPKEGSSPEKQSSFENIKWQK